VASLVVGLEGPAAGVAVGWLREQGASGGGGGSRPASIHCSFVPDTNGLLGVPVAARRRGDYKSIDATSGCVLCTGRAQLQGSKLVSKSVRSVNVRPTLTVRDSHECADEILYALRKQYSLQMMTEGHSR